MKTQKVTLSIPKELLLKVELIAVRRETSISGLLTRMLEKLVQEEDSYARARLEQGVDLGTGGQMVIQRDELHERG